MELLSGSVTRDASNQSQNRLSILRALSLYFFEPICTSRCQDILLPFLNVDECCKLTCHVLEPARAFEKANFITNYYRVLVKEPIFKPGHLNSSLISFQLYHELFGTGWGRFVTANLAKISLECWGSVLTCS